MTLIIKVPYLIDNSFMRLVKMTLIIWAPVIMTLIINAPVLMTVVLLG